MNRILLRGGDCVEVLRTFDEASVEAVITDPPYGLEFMGKDWDNLTSWQTGGGFAKPGIGDRHTAWPSFSATSRFGTTNPTCAVCGGRLRGAKKCSCEQPHDHWKPIGKRKDPENESLPDTMTGTGMRKHLRAMQDWHETWLRECFRVLRPGGVIKAFSGTRTQHRLTAAMESVGFVDLSVEAWSYGSGFPKSLNLGKAIDRQWGRLTCGSSLFTLKHDLKALFDASGKSRKQIDEECGFRACNYLSYPEEGSRPDPWFHVLPTGHKWGVIKNVLNVNMDASVEARLDQIFAEAKREVLGYRKAIPGVAFSSEGPAEIAITAPATPEAQTWDGWGTALKPAWEPFITARKPGSPS